jgi:hypothetical protein
LARGDAITGRPRGDREGAERRAGVARAVTDPQRRGAGGQGVEDGVDHRQRRRRRRDLPRAEGRRRAGQDLGLERPRQRQVRDEAAGAGPAQRELLQKLLQLSDGVGGGRQVKQRAGGGEAGRRRGRSGLLHRAAAELRPGGRRRDQHDPGAVGAGRHHAVERVPQPGAGGGDDRGRSTAGEVRLDRREGGAALVAGMEQPDWRRGQARREGRDATAEDAEGLAHAELGQPLAAPARGGDRLGGGPGSAGAPADHRGFGGRRLRELGDGAGQR